MIALFLIAGTPARAQEDEASPRTATANATVTATAAAPAPSPTTIATTPAAKPKAPTPTPRPPATATAPVKATSTAVATALPQAATNPRRADKVIYLTFDDGPGEWTQPILDVLARYDARATFFVLGVQAAEWPDMIEGMYEAGHGVANHTWKHVNLAGVSQSYFDAEIEDTAEAIGTYESKCLRPPYGARNQSTYTYAEELGYDIALWSIDTGDWRQPGARAIAHNVLDHIHNRAVVLMHDGGGDRSQTVAALRILLPELVSRGFEMRAVCRDDPMPQVGDYIVGIPSELDLEVPTPEAGAADTAASAPAYGDVADADNLLLAGDSVLAPPQDALSEVTEAASLAEGSAGAITFPAQNAIVRGRILVQGYVNDHPAAVAANTAVAADTAAAADTAPAADTAAAADTAPAADTAAVDEANAGSAQNGIVGWRLDLLDADPPQELAAGTPTNRLGALGVWDTRTVANGLHTLRLEITHADGTIEQRIVDVTVRN